MNTIFHDKGIFYTVQIGWYKKPIMYSMKRAIKELYPRHTAQI